MYELAINREDRILPLSNSKTPFGELTERSCTIGAVASLEFGPLSACLCNVYDPYRLFIPEQTQMSYGMTNEYNLSGLHRRIFTLSRSYHYFGWSQESTSGFHDTFITFADALVPANFLVLPFSLLHQRL